MSKLKKIILSGLLLALLIVFDRFISIKTLYLQISFSFLPIALSAILLGPKYSDEEILETLSEKFDRVKNGKGIAYTISMKSVIGVSIYKFLSNVRA